MIRNLLFMILVIGVAGNLKAQYVQPSETPVTPVKKAIYLKAAVGKSIGLSFYDLSFDQSNAYADVTVSPGSGYNFAFGSDFRTAFFDFDLTLEESILFGYILSSSNGNSTSFSCSMFKTNFLLTAFAKIPVKEDQNFLRIGGGPFLAFPSGFQAKMNGDALGYAKYPATWGYHLDVNLAIAAKTVYVDPGIRLKIADLQSSEITFQQNQNELRNFNISSIDLYLAIIF